MSRLLIAVLGLFAIGIGCLLPLEWFRPVHAEQLGLPDALIGGRLFRDCLFLNGALLLLLAFFARMIPLQENRPPSRLLVTRKDETLPRPVALGLLAVIIALGSLLRLWHLNSGLWLDEISPVVRYGDFTFLQVLSTYLGSDNHLLNTVLVNFCLRTFGPSEWAARLPATLFGIAAIPLFYGVTRFVSGRLVSLSAALLLAVSYQHIFFSQNARGYSAYLTFCLGGTILLVLALRAQRLLWWLAYMACMLLAAASHLNAIFVIAAHALLCLAFTFFQSREHPWRWSDLVQPALVFGGLALLVLQVYSPVIPQVRTYMGTVYHAPSAGFASPLAPEFVHDLLHGISAGWLLGAGMLIPLLLAILLVGTVQFVRENWLIAGALLLPCLVFGGFVVVLSLHVTPRLFLLVLFPAILAVTLCVDQIARRIELRMHRPCRLPVMVAAVLVLALGSATSLRAYYARPKQDYAGAVHYLQEHRKSGDIVIVVYLAEQGYKFYAAKLDPASDPNCFFVRNPERFGKIVRDHPGGTVWIVTTFERALRIDFPTLHQEIHASGPPTAQFPGTVADGDIAIYQLKAADH